MKNSDRIKVLLESNVSLNILFNEHSFINYFCTLLKLEREFIKEYEYSKRNIKIFY